MTRFVLDLLGPISTKQIGQSYGNPRFKHWCFHHSHLSSVVFGFQGSNHSHIISFYLPTSLSISSKNWSISKSQCSPKMFSRYFHIIFARDFFHNMLFLYWPFCLSLYHSNFLLHKTPKCTLNAYSTVIYVIVFHVIYTTVTVSNTTQWTVPALTIFLITL